MKLFGWICAGLVALALLIGGSYAYRYYMAPVKGVVGAEETLESAGKRISSYDSFFDLCANAQTMQGNIKDQEFNLSKLDMKTDPELYKITLTNVTGMKSRLRDVVNQYNANSQKEYTTARFKSSNLPSRLNADQPITCR